MDNTNTKGHILAVITVLIWGTTFISTKTLLHDFTPVEILFFRFIMGLILLTAAYPKILHTGSRKREGVFALAGLTGVCLYYLMENVALTYTTASNVGVIVATAPFFYGSSFGRHKKRQCLFLCRFCFIHGRNQLNKLYLRRTRLQSSRRPAGTLCGIYVGLLLGTS